ncbi:hypothetical protein [Sphaerisporangium perillae]|uniref:hypothetical protein n=1 Tax=Sphaerisporangium perillae TaxID=2935860 RepID=UPI00200DC9D8|nr:hypothetical protein [Sphaerisporangium perillae]
MKYARPALAALALALVSGCGGQPDVATPQAVQRTATPQAVQRTATPQAVQRTATPQEVIQQLQVAGYSCTRDDRGFEGIPDSNVSVCGKAYAFVYNNSDELEKYGTRPEVFDRMVYATGGYFGTNIEKYPLVELACADQDCAAAARTLNWGKQATDEHSDETPQPTSTFVRRADGGKFASPQELIDTLNELGVACGDAEFGTSRLNEPAGKCWSGSGNIYVNITKQMRLLLLNTRSRPVVYGRNWVVLANEDPDFAVEVKNTIGGEYIQ